MPRLEKGGAMMKSRTVAIFLLAIVVVGGIVYTLYGDKLSGPSDKDQVEALANTLVKAVSRGNREALEESLDDEFVFDRSDAIVTREQFIEDVIKGDLWARLSDEQDLEIAGDAAFLTAPFDANVLMGDEFFEVSGTMTIDFIKQGQTWSVRSIRIMPLF
jgi:hypothetical protein